MKKLLSVFLFFSIFFSGVCLAASPEKTKAAKESYLFIQVVPEAKMKLIDSEKNIYKLKLKDVNETIAYVSNRPTRVRGLMPLDDFLKNWQSKNANSFGQDAPNAAIVAVKKGQLKKEEPLHFAVILSNPEYNSKEETLTYTAQLLKGSSSLPQKIEFEDVALFIDNMGGFVPQVPIS